MLTAYDYPTRVCWMKAGSTVLLVGDSLGMVVLGYPDTTQRDHGEWFTIAARRCAARKRVRGRGPSIATGVDTPELAVIIPAALEAGAQGSSWKAVRALPQIAEIVGRHPRDGAHRHVAATSPSGRRLQDQRQDAR